MVTYYPGADPQEALTTHFDEWMIVDKSEISLDGTYYRIRCLRNMLLSKIRDRQGISLRTRSIGEYVFRFSSIDR